MDRKRVVGKIQDLLSETEEFLMNIINIPSPSSQEEDVIGEIENVFKRNGLRVNSLPIGNDIKRNPHYCNVLEDINYDNRRNLVIRFNGQDPQQGGLLINTHLDVVPASERGKAKYSSLREEDRIFGRGACDAKGQIATIFLFLRTLQELHVTPKKGICVHLVVEEEIGGNGTLSIMQEDWNFGKAIVMEPTDLQILSAARGAVWFKLLVEGKSGHSGDVKHSSNAILKMIYAMKELTDFHSVLCARSKDIEPFKNIKNPMPLTFGSFHSGDWPATVPDKAEVKGVLGYLQNVSGQDVMLEINERLYGLFEEKEFELEFIFRRDASITDRSHPFIHDMQSACELSGLSTELGAFPACCDAWFYTNKEIPTVIFGPGLLSHAHSADEQILVEDIAKGAEVLVNLILKGDEKE